MELNIDFEALTEIIRKADGEGRDSLFEYEVYDFLRLSGSETPPRTKFLPMGKTPNDEDLTGLPGDKVVLKIVSPTILHKTDVGGVMVGQNRPIRLRSRFRRMTSEVPERYADWIERNRAAAPAAYCTLEGDALRKAIKADVTGVLLCEYMPPDSHEFGNEMIVGIRRTREFGMVINAGVGGTHTEMYASRFRKGQAAVAASTEMIDGETFFELFKTTVAYRTMAGLTRGGKRIVTDEQLIECFSSFIPIANQYSPMNRSAPFVIEELEINPFAFTDFLMVPLDGLCKFSTPTALPPARPIHKIDNLLHPKSIGVVGVSSKGMNIGRIILQNILACGFDKEKVFIVRPGGGEIDGVKCVPSLSEAGEKLDLFVLAVSADQVPDMVAEIADGDLAETVLLIPGGLGETKGSEGKQQAIKEKINAAHLHDGGGPLFLGGNSLGILSHPGRYDTLFIPEEKLPKDHDEKERKTAFISQSGAYMITRMSKLPFMDPAYALSIGNQVDLTAGDLMRFFKNDPSIDILAVYIEGFQDLDGLAFAGAVREAVLAGKDVIFYKAGRTPEGKSATSGHTASLAGNYTVCESCVAQAGAMVARTFTEFEELYKLAAGLHDKTMGGTRIGAVSNAGYESVGMADNILGNDYRLTLESFTPETSERLAEILKESRLDTLVDVKNPMDINPMATDATYEAIMEAVIKDANIDMLVLCLVPLTGALKTLEDTLADDSSIARRVPRLVQKFDKPVVAVVDSGRLFDPLENMLQESGVVTFRSSDRAVWTLGRYARARLFAEELRRG